jgi:hypothetical protein
MLQQGGSEMAGWERDGSSGQPRHARRVVKAWILGAGSPTVEGKALPADLLTGLGHIRRRSARCAPLGRRHAMWWCEIDRQDTAPVHH